MYTHFSMHQPITIKTLRWVLFASGFFLFGACNRLDPELIDAVQTRLTRIQESRPELEEGLQNTTHLLEQIQKAPAGLRENPEFGFRELTSKLETLKSEYRKLQEKHDSLYTKLDGLVGNYIDGQTKKRALVKGMNSSENTMAGLKRTRDALALQFNEYSAKFARMSATFAALPAPEQAALNNRYDGIPDTLPKPVFRPAIKKTVDPSPKNTQENEEQHF